MMERPPNRRVRIAEPYKWADLIFCIEEVDTDPKKVCWQRDDSTAVAEAEEEAEPDADSQEENPKKKGKKKAKQSKGDKLSLGTLLTILDGGCPTPGRLIIMTTNQVW
eukprot:SAG11_NODE_542_length_8640_cov_5.667603_5_plen_108_part_00